MSIIYGKEYYLNSYLILVLLAVINLFGSVNGIFGCFITARGFQKYKLVMQTEFVFVSLISMFTLYKYGVYGAVSAYMISIIYSCFRYFFLLKENW